MCRTTNDQHTPTNRLTDSEGFRAHPADLQGMVAGGGRLGIVDCHIGPASIFATGAERTARPEASAAVYPDPEQALKYTGASSADYNLAGLRGLTPLNLPDYRSFTDLHREFLVLCNNSRFDWIVPKLQRAGAQLRLYSTQDEGTLCLVDLPEAADIWAETAK